MRLPCGQSGLPEAALKRNPPKWKPFCREVAQKPKALRCNSSYFFSFFRSSDMDQP